MKITRTFLLSLLASALFMGCDKPVNIIFLIGDGMGLSQISSAYYFGDAEPNFTRFRNIGLIRTHSGSHRITDSAAGATAFASGVKTYNGAIGMDIDHQPVPTILEQLSKEGWITALVSTSSITHATPGSFYAHVETRNMEEEIALDLVQSQVDFFAGGGTDFFVRRKDGRNLLDSLNRRGFRVDTLDISNPITDFSRKPAYLLAPRGLPPAHKGRGDFLSQAAERSFEYVDAQKKPFFIMIEGSQIDWAGHDNDGEYLIAEMLDFDKVVGQALDFAKRKGNTLVIVTADHETGGFTLSSKTTVDSTGRKSSDYDQIEPTFSTGGHSSTLIPVFAWGKGSEKFAGIYQNTQLYFLMRELSGLK